jgi:Fur family peroxide stress response transcriptional regulator
METTLQQLLGRLRRNGLRITPKRRALLRLLFAQVGRHFSAQEIYDILEQQFPAITLATVYNNLHVLEEVDAVASLGFPGQDGALYEIEHGRHINLICESCGRVQDLDLPEISALEKRAAELGRYQITHSAFQMFGYCGDCATLEENG